ncbi:hypothetical protein [Streptosporangium sp. NPDC048865]|uniref:hypothetical protein n=1 Tax=Streptosporangium sp. NPDC048865 TaxID=3155766 RepID=UPI00343596AD
MNEPQPVPTVWTRRLQIATAVSSAVFTVGTAAQNFLVINLEMIEHSMRLSGLGPSDAAAQAPGLLAFLRTVGALFIVGNALGLLAPRGWTWVFWTAVIVNIGQAAGPLGMIPPVVYRSSIELYGPAGILPTVITDGGAFFVALALVASFARYRTPWARLRRPATGPAPR